MRQSGSSRRFACAAVVTALGIALGAAPEIVLRTER